MNKENCALKLVDEIILYYDARLKKHQKIFVYFVYLQTEIFIRREVDCLFRTLFMSYFIAITW